MSKTHSNTQKLSLVLYCLLFGVCFKKKNSENTEEKKCFSASKWFDSVQKEHIIRWVPFRYFTRTAKGMGNSKAKGMGKKKIPLQLKPFLKSRSGTADPLVHAVL